MVILVVRYNIYNCSELRVTTSLAIWLSWVGRSYNCKRLLLETTVSLKGWLERVDLILAAPVHRGNGLSHGVLLSLGVTWHREGQHLLCTLSRSIFSILKCDTQQLIQQTEAYNPFLDAQLRRWCW
jgi:hypothetical protein